MIPKLHYQLEAVFYRKEIGDKFDFLVNGGDLKDSITNYKKKFQDASPIIARENAFNHYQSIIEVLYDGLGKTYTCDIEARFDLQKYFNSGNDIELLGDRPGKFKVSDDIFNDISIYLIIDTPIFKDDLKGDKYLIHSIGYLENSKLVYDDVPIILKGLIKECEYFEQCSYPFKDYYSVLDFTTSGGKIETILKTPFDWDAFMLNKACLNLW